jgi:riboflavin synthase
MQMFTGLVEEVGTVRSTRRRGDYQELWVNAEAVTSDLKRGDSVSIDGACQTVTALDARGFAVETLAVSLKKTTLGALSRGAAVNLERALTPSTRMGGHFVQGHVDGTGRVSKLQRRGENIYLELVLPDELARYCIAEGSIAVDGVSLTIADLRGTRVTINVIPTTWNDTALRSRSVGDYVNIEVDVLARYVERLMGTASASAPGPQSGGTR